MSKKTPSDHPEYQYLIPERQQILDYLIEAGQPCGIRAISAALMEEDHSESRKALKRRLRAMERDGQIIRNRKEGYAPIDKIDLLKGRVIAHPDGYGFMALDQGGEDLFLSPKQMRKVLHGDRILARISGVDHRGRQEVSIVEVLERANQAIVGRYDRDGHLGYLIPENKRIHQDILIPDGKALNAKPGEIVVASILQQPDKHSQPVGEVIQILGNPGDPGMAVDIAIHNFNLPNEWPEPVLEAIQAFDETVPVAEFPGHRDIRDLPLVTIDGEDARDFDDAVFCEPQGSGWRMVVAIADVSSYVRTGSALDEEAFNRATSVYFPQRVIPMLPEVLSNGLCSLNPKVDRLCMVCELNIDRNGKVKRSEFYQGIMRSVARLTYNRVAAAVEKDKAVCEELADVLPQIKNLHSLYQLLHEQRKQNGLLDFESSEPSFIFTETGEIESIGSYERNDAHRMIEEFMLAANVAAANYLLEQQCPAMYRVHETPKAEKLNDLRSFLSELGLQLNGGDEPTAKDYARLMEQIQGREDHHLINMVLLRSMPLAIYEADNKGHFGLAFEAYTHFTSPIRRYPDLMVHRAIKHLIDGGQPENYAYSQGQVQEMATHCSTNERRAEEASREVIKWYKCKYIYDKIGEQFMGTISSVTSFGLFVELDDIYIEGLVHVTSLVPQDYYHYEAVGHRLRGERSNHVFQLGQRLEVKVVNVNLEDKKIDFELV